MTTKVRITRLDRMLLIPPVLYYSFVSIQAVARIMEEPLQYVIPAVIFLSFWLVLFWVFSFLDRRSKMRAVEKTVKNT